MWILYENVYSDIKIIHNDKTVIIKYIQQYKRQLCCTEITGTDRIIISPSILVCMYSYRINRIVACRNESIKLLLNKTNKL